MAVSHTKICPGCGALNDANDLFCKDCGGSLAMVSPSSGQTTAFTPVQESSDTQTTTIAPAIEPPPVRSSSYATLETPVYYGSMPQQESTRRAVLGWIAASVMLLIIGFFVWSSLLTDAARDSFTGFF